MKKDTLYISFHRPVGVLGHLIAIWTLGKYSHCEFIYNNTVYLANPGGVRSQPYKELKNADIYELDKSVLATDVLDFFNEIKGSGYDYRGILGSQFLWFLNKHDSKKYFCSEFCLNAIDYSYSYTMKDRVRLIHKKGYNKYNPERLYKLLKRLNLIRKEK